MALCWLWKSFRAQPLLHFSMDLDQTFTKQLLSRDLAHIVRNFLFNHFKRSYGPLLTSKIVPSATSPTFLNGFGPNFHKTIVIKGPGAYRQDFFIRGVVALCWLWKWFRVQLLLHFSMDLDQTFTKQLLLSDLAHIIKHLLFNHFKRIYGPLFTLKMHKNSFWEQLLLHFSTDFNKTFL